ncbi:hypothetical protein P3C22_08625 [Pseudomonas sp. ER28]|uniref:hypothetical protein n=1 Tax=Pseudomonas TaxID=286 RepID=UPI0006B51FDD|nr:MULTISPECIES: hypothetical protein [Pseudomonas]MDF3172118.1 hypothetical protein [Pseudomonas sp. ER28]USX36227.1 hypothetical protein NH673_24060 [Pseudomonas putida]
MFEFLKDVGAPHCPDVACHLAAMVAHSHGLNKLERLMDDVVTPSAHREERMSQVARQLHIAQWELQVICASRSVERFSSALSAAHGQLANMLEMEWGDYCSLGTTPRETPIKSAQAF